MWHFARELVVTVLLLLFRDVLAEFWAVGGKKVLLPASGAKISYALGLEPP